MKSIEMSPYPRTPKKLLASLSNCVQIFLLICDIGIRHMKHRIYSVLSIGLLALSSLASTTHAASWIWNPDDTDPGGSSDPRFFRYAFTLVGGWESAELEMSVDNTGTAFLNGERIANSREWQRPAHADLASKLRQGRNVIAIRASNQGGAAGLVARLKIKRREGPHPTLETNGNWVTSLESEEAWMDLEFDDSKWAKASIIATLGDQPWGNVFQSPETTKAESLEVPKGFKVERILSSNRGQGSWIAMTFDGQGRAIISPQSDNDPLLRITDISSDSPKVEVLSETKVRHAMGLLFAHDSLYINGHGPKGTGLYRWIDANKDDRWTDDETLFLKAIRGEGEHGYHGLRLGPDGMIYMMNGNHTRVPEGVREDSPHQNYKEDHLLPRQWDGNGHATGVMAPGGYIVRTDAEGKQWELMLAGYRNAYDFDFNADGEMFAFDSDMEWDWGTPWYRPTRVIHSVTGGEYGWRSGTSKWPSSFEDSLPATIDIGIGSPTGVCFGYGTKFPARYQKALYVMDWSYGRIVAVHLMPDGASYFASKETFVRGKPLNVSDMEVGPDGALYFVVGGRGTQSGLYRVTYVGDEPTAKVSYVSKEEADARLLRQKLESFHGKPNPEAIAFTWPHLRSPDRWIRYAARVALESQPVSQWGGRVIDEYSVQGSLTGLMALARIGEKHWQDLLLAKLQEIVTPDLPEEQQMQVVRILQLSFIRMGKPSEGTTETVTAAIGQFFPSESQALNKELCRLAVYFEIPDLIGKSLDLLDDSKHIEDQLHYIFTLRSALKGWSLEQRRRYFSWFNQDFNGAQHPANVLTWFAEVDRTFSFGASFNKFLANIKKDATATLSNAEKIALSDILEGGQVVAKNRPPNPILTRSEFKEWAMADIEPALGEVKKGRNYEQGRLAYEAAQCSACHRFGNEGGSVGPDLTAISSRFASKDILDSIIHPSKVLSEQYVYEKVITKDDEQYTGRIVNESDEKIELLENPYSEIRTSIKVSNIQSRENSKLSPMPEGLIQVLKKDEILDLLAYLESGGNPKHDNFK